MKERSERVSFVKFASRLKELREAKGFSQRELAKLLVIAPSTLAMYELGQREPDFEIATKIADFFDVSVDYLLGRTDDPRPLRKQIEDAVEGDPELKEFWEAFLSKRELRLAFRTIKDLDPVSLRKVIRVIKAIEEEEGSYQPDEK
ncbi:MAG TPA: helix-turn-helix transcriptional regulator [Firmicutes bacterium]|nr:helix-turn-helix transcriptional regulator [Bacillota bacterium]